MFDKILSFLNEVRLEIKKINWPGRQKTIQYTLIVLAISVAIAAYLGSLDFLFTLLLNKFIF